MTALLKSFWNDESGQAQVEYGLIIALIAAAIIGTLAVFGQRVQEIFTNMNTKITEAAS